MTDKGKKILVVIAAMLVLLSVMFLFAPKHSYRADMHTVIEVKNGEAEKDSFKIT